MIRCLVVLLIAYCANSLNLGRYEEIKSVNLKTYSEQDIISCKKCVRVRGLYAFTPMSIHNFAHISQQVAHFRQVCILGWSERDDFITMTGHFTRRQCYNSETRKVLRLQNFTTSKSNLYKNFGVIKIFYIICYATFSRRQIPKLYHEHVGNLPY